MELMKVQFWTNLEGFSVRCSIKHANSYEVIHMKQNYIVLGSTICFEILFVMDKQLRAY